MASCREPVAILPAIISANPQIKSDGRNYGQIRDDDAEESLPSKFFLQIVNKRI